MDYVDIALESLLEENVMMRNITINRMVAESEFILSSMENGVVGEFVQEASIKEMAKTIINKLREFIDKIVTAFRRKTVERYKKYISWVKENAGKIKEKASNASITLAPYWDGDQQKGASQIDALIADAFKTPYEADDISFATKILPSIKTKDDLNDTGKISASLKNRFRFNVDEPDNGKIKKVELKGNDLSSKIDDMISYVLNYEKVSQGLTSISNKWIAATNRFSAATESMNNFSKDMFLLVENTYLCNSDLSLLEGFDNIPVLEAENGNSANTNTNDGKQNESLTSVQNNSPDRGSDGNKPGGSNTMNRYNMVDRFVRLAFSAYLTACEERFIVYVKCISQILGESPKETK